MRERPAGVRGLTGQGSEGRVWTPERVATRAGAARGDQSDGGEDEDEFENRQWAERLEAEGRNPGTPWLSQTPVLKILGDDFVASEGDVVWNILGIIKLSILS